MCAPPAAAQCAALPPEPTGSLYRFVRDDSPAHATRVAIRVRPRFTARISPDLFGNFIEYLGGVVDYTLTAQVVFNPDLESADGGATAPEGWRLQDADWQAGGFHSAHCLRLMAKTADGKSSELRQRLSRRIEANVGLRGAIFLRAPQTPGTVTVELRAGDTHFAATLKSDSADWTRREFTFPASAKIASGEPATLIIRHAGGGAVDCDRITLTPANAVGAIAADTAQKAKDWNIPLLRWPGGNFASGYDWRDGVGPKDERPTRKNAAWGGLESNQIGADEFLKFCDFLHCQPQITVNAGDGTPENAADWVAYCNAKTDAPGRAGEMARLRAANGRRQPYSVRTWEIGNELYGGWQIGHTDSAGNAARFVRFRDVMRAVDPTIRTIATGSGYEFIGDGLKHNAEWNDALLRAAVAHGGTPPDYLAIHPLVPLPGGLKGLSYEAQYESAMAHPTFLSDTFIPALARQITAIEGPNARTRIAATEWGIIVGGDTWRNSPNHDSLAGAIYNALALNAMLRHSDWVTLANMTAFAHGGGIKRKGGALYVDPQYYVQQIYAAAQLHTPVETTTTGPGRDVPQRGDLPAVPNVPDVDVAAALGAKNTLTAFAINRHLTEARTLTLTLTGFDAAHCRAVQLTAASPKEGNTENPNHIAPKPFPLPLSRLRSGETLQITLPPHTFIALTFTP